MITIKNLRKTAAAAIILFSFLFITDVHAAECDSINDELSSKFRFLGQWDENGTPKYLDAEGDKVSEALIDYINTALPESVKVPQNSEEYFGDNVQLNTELKEKSKVYLTMVHEGADWKNTLGFYTYDIDNPPQTVYDIDSLVIVFPNVSQYNVVQPGNKVLLGEFPAETGIGYFLIAQGWKGDTVCIASHMVFTDSHLNTFTTKEYQQQTILLNYQSEDQLLLCFEDIKRPGGDNDFNDAVFYLTAEPGAIDTTNIPVIPTAHIVGDTTICDENAPAELTLTLTGKAPWTVTFTNGMEEQTINDISDETYSFETLMRDSIWIKSFEDARKPGVKSGYAMVHWSNPTATLIDQPSLCSNDQNLGGFIVELEGIAPFSLTYNVDGIEYQVDGLLEKEYELTAEVGKTVQLVSVMDKYCMGDVNDVKAIISYQAAPALSVSGTGTICEGENFASIDLSLEGDGPWKIEYTIGDQEYFVESNANEYQLQIEQPGLVQFESLTDANCSYKIMQSVEVVAKAVPSANITRYSSECGDEVATIDLQFDGEGPWSLDYKVNGELYSLESQDAEYSFELTDEGLFELVSVRDAFCEGSLDESQEVVIYESPTATISGDAAICDNEAATIQIALTGTAPFAITYTDGENQYSASTNENLFEFTTSDHTTYTLISVEDAFCVGAVEGSATISDGSEDLNVEIVAADIGCFGENIELTLLGETDNLDIQWTTDGQGMLNIENQINAIYTPGESETGEVEFFAEVTNGCAVKTVSKTVTIIEELNAEFDISPSDNHLTNTTITFTPNESGYDSFLWDFGDENSSTATIASTEYEQGGIYEVGLTVEKEGCEASGSMEIEVLSKDELYIPNAFHPNAQNPENQVIKVYGNNISERNFFFKIVNRWGKVMYETSSFNEANTVGWNGINNNNDVELELNVFTYIVRGQFIEGNTFEETGTITQVK
jgi:PKD repeat protein